MRNILLVDDEIITITAIDRNVDWKKCGLSNLYLANTSMAVKEIVSSTNIDIVISDIEMPNENGMDLAKWLHENHPGIIVILLTAHAEFRYAREAISLGVFDYLLKPVIYEELEDKIIQALEVLDGRESQDAKSGRKGALAWTPEEEPFEDAAAASDIVKKVQKYVDENLDMVITRQEIANHVSLNESYLSRLFKKETGVSISDYILQKRMSRAKALLIRSSMSISNVALEVGYAYPAYFIKMFKREVGKTPKEYRNQMRI